MKKVYVRWLDSFYEANGWKNRGGDGWKLDDLICESCGFLLRETDELVEITHSINPSQIMAPFAIPKAAILEMRKLKCSSG